MPFRTELHTRVGSGRNEYILTLPLVYETDVGETIVVPPGFITDLASIPWLARTIVPHNRAERMPAVLHDYLFVVQDRPLGEVNALMYEAMRSTGVGLYARTMIRAGLTLGSWVPWRRNARERERNPWRYYEFHGLDPARYGVPA